MKPLNAGVKPGDIFYIPGINKEGTYGFVLARYIELIKPNLGYLIEIFSEFYTSLPASIDHIDVSKRLFRPVMCSLLFRNLPRWKIIFSNPSYEKSQSEYENISIEFYDGDLWSGGEIIPLNRKKAGKYEDSTCWRMKHLIFRVNAHLAGLLGPNDSYDYDRLPKNCRVDSPDADAKVIDVAVVVDNLFKEWALSDNKR